MMLVVAGLTATGLYIAQRNATGALQEDLQRDFQADLAALHGVEELRHAALAERCRTLAAKPRIHAALEDNALDLLYPSAKDELRDIMQDETNPRPDETAGVPHARFYRFLDGAGSVLPPPNSADVGILHADEEAQLTLKPLPQTPQIGYLLRASGTEEETVDEIIALPIQWRGRNPPPGRIRRQPSDCETALRSGGKARDRFRGKPGPAQARRSRSGVQARRTATLDPVLGRCIASTQNPGNRFTRRD